MEKRNIPTAVIITDFFISTVEVIASVSGIPDYPFAVIPHPIGRLKQAEIEDRAKKVLPKVIELLALK